MNADHQIDSALQIIPLPAKLDSRPGRWGATGSTLVLTPSKNDEVRRIGQMLADKLSRKAGQSIAVIDDLQAATTFPGSTIGLRIVSNSRPANNEAYDLTIDKDTISLEAAAPSGLFRGVQTLSQVLSIIADAPTSQPINHVTWSLPCCRIEDYPRYPHRGLLLDCGRHFMPVDFVKRYIDLLAYHKMNVLHWHLTEDQGWRIEIKKYPKLTEIGAWRKATRDDEQPRDAKGRYGGFYTQQQIRDIVAYAKDRYITIIPEIEMPGHSLAALAAYPELSCRGKPLAVGADWGVFDDVYCAGNDKVFDFLEDVLTEVIDLFPSTYIHIGGDECPKTRWHECPKCHARIKSEHLKDEHELQSYFIRRIEKFLNSKGRRLIGWDEILEGGLAPNATVQSWRGMDGAVAAATTGHDVIASPTSHCYLDYPQWDDPSGAAGLTLETVYSFEPTPASLSADQARHILGVEGNMWTEHAPPQRIDWQVFPRLCVLAEIGWSPKDSRNWSDFQRRMDTHYARLEAFGVTYFIPPPTLLRPQTAFTDDIQFAFAPPFRDGAIHFTLDGRDPTTDSPIYRESSRLTKSATVRARTFRTNGRASDEAAWPFRRLQPNQPIAVSNPMPGLALSLFEGQHPSMPKLRRMTPKSTTVAPALDLTSAPSRENYCLLFEGLFEAQREGTYTFFLKADDEAHLTIGAEDPAVVEARWNTREQSASAWLKPGLHPLRLEFRQIGGAQELSVAFQVSDEPKQTIPARRLSHSGNK